LRSLNFASAIVRTVAASGGVEGLFVIEQSLVSHELSVFSYQLRAVCRQLSVTDY
jgi:hypothetical protein